MNSESGIQLPNEFMRVIVFGGAGFFGSHLLEALAAATPQIEFFSVDIAEPRFKVAGVNYVSHDVTKTMPSQLCGSGEAMIFNLAAVHTTPGHEDWKYYRTNILGARNIRRFAIDINVRHIVLTSSISVYGPSEPKNEDSELEPVSAYGRSKAMAERIHNLWRSERSDDRVDDRPARSLLWLHRKRKFHPASQSPGESALRLSRPKKNDQLLRLRQGLRDVNAVYSSKERKCGSLQFLLSGRLYQ